MNILTFDIEEWFHLLEHPQVRDETSWGRLETRLPQMLDRILDLLDETGRKGCFFCLGWVARTYPELVRRIDERGHELASHSDVHSLIFEQTPAAFRQELVKSKRTLEDVSGKRIRAFRAPGFSLVERCSWAFDILIEEGFEIDCSVFPASRAHGGMPAFPSARPVWVETSAGRIKEFPMSVARVLGRAMVFSGGGYFRVIPALILERLWADSDYVMTYFHPRDFEPDQPMLPGLGPLRRFKSYYGLGRAAPKLKRLLQRHEFISLAQADSQVDWTGAETVRIDTLQPATAA